MATAYHSVPQASGSVYATQRSSKLLMRKIPYVGFGYEQGDYNVKPLSKFHQVPNTARNSNNYSLNELHNRLHEKCKTSISYYLIVRKKTRL